MHFTIAWLPLFDGLFQPSTGVQHEHQPQRRIPRITRPILAELIAAQTPPPPFAVAVNTRFVPKTQYSGHLLQAGDQVDIVRPVVGG